LPSAGPGAGSFVVVRFEPLGDKLTRVTLDRVHPRRRDKADTGARALSATPKRRFPLNVTARFNASAATFSAMLIELSNSRQGIATGGQVLRKVAAVAPLVLPGAAVDFGNIFVPTAAPEAAHPPVARRRRSSCL